MKILKNKALLTTKPTPISLNGPWGHTKATTLDPIKIMRLSERTYNHFIHAGFGRGPEFLSINVVQQRNNSKKQSLVLPGRVVVS